MSQLDRASIEVAHQPALVKQPNPTRQPLHSLHLPTNFPLPPSQPPGCIHNQLIQARNRLVLLDQGVDLGDCFELAFGVLRV
jgi:hypothetical protein